MQIDNLNQIIHTARMEFIDLLNKSWRSAQNYLQRYGRDDIRCDFFIVFSELNLWLILLLDNFLEHLESGNTKISQYMILTPEDWIQFLLQCDTVNRASYCTKAMFDVEYFLASIRSSAKSASTFNKHYFNFTKDLLLYIDINDEHTHKVLNAPAQLRNSLHNNGYADHDFEVTLRGITYKFSKGKQVGSSGWSTIYVFFDELVNVLVEIIENPKVKNIDKIAHTRYIIKK
jgi:hypothetical protein